MVQRDISTIVTNATADLADNSIQAISAADVRNIIVDTLNSLLARGTGTLNQNSFLMVGSDGQTVTQASMEELPDNITFDKSCVFLPSEIMVGDAGIRFADPVISFRSNRTNRDFLAIGVPYNASGTGNPMQISLAASEVMPATAQQPATDTTFAMTAGDTLEFSTPGGSGVDHVLASFVGRASVAGTVRLELFVGLNADGNKVLDMTYQVNTSDTTITTDALPRIVAGQTYFSRITAVTDITLVGTGTDPNFLPYYVPSGWPYSEIVVLNENNVVANLEARTGDDRLNATAIRNLPTPGISGISYQEEGGAVVTASTLNVVGAGATLTNVGGVATLTIPGGENPPIAGPNDLRYGLSDQSAPVDVVFANLTDVASPTDPQTVSTGVSTAGDYFYIFSANTHDITSIRDTVLDQIVYQDPADPNNPNIFTKTSDARIESGVTYDAYQIGPLNAGVNEDYIVRFS